MVLVSLHSWLICILCVFLVFLCNFVHCFNLSPRPNAVIKDPQLKTGMKKYESSYFGFSLNLRPKGLIIGAPRAQSVLDSQRKINETGAIYRCPLDSSCYQYVFESQGNTIIENSKNTFDSERHDFQWLGASMDGGLNDADKLIVCAPRLIALVPNSDYLMHGICYWINDTLEATIKNVKKISPLRLQQDQIRADKPNKYYYYILAEMGLSAHVTPDNSEFIIGAPGINMWKGSVIRYRKRTKSDHPNLSYDSGNYYWDIPNPDDFNQPDVSYFGYSVGSGYFDSRDKKRLMYISTAPQANVQSGEGYLFDIKGEGLKKRFVFRGEQFGEYFGYACLAEDVNGDDLTDVIISAPQYSITGSFEDGAIYVFINKGRFNFERKLMTSPIHGKARFGTTLTRLGDIDHDGYNDIAVGAPFADDGSVFVYLGSASGLRNQPSQRFDSPKELIQSTYQTHMFGHGLSKGSDIDNNGFNDFAIGAPNAETVLLYKAYPVVKILATIHTSTREIKTSQTSFSFEICYGISTTSTKTLPQMITLHVVADPQVKRVKFLSTGKTETKLEVNATSEMECVNLDCNVKYSESDIFKPIDIELHYGLVNQIPDSTVFCDICAAVDPDEPKIVAEKIIYSTGCKAEICVADMRVQSSGLEYSFVLGSSETFTVIYDVFNYGDTAYLPQINITSSKNLPFAKYPLDCKVNYAVMLCNLNHGQPMENGTRDTVTVTYDVSALSGRNMILKAQVFSTGKELNPLDNIIKEPITLIEYTEIDATGITMTPNIHLENDLKSAEVINNYEIKSNGPSKVDEMKVIFSIPVAYRIQGSNATVPIIDMTNITMQAIYDLQFVKVNFFQNKTKLKMKSIINRGSLLETENKIQNISNDFEMTSLVGPKRRRREAKTPILKPDQYARIARYNSFDSLSDDLKGTLPVNRSLVFNCHDSEIVVCVKAVIRVYDFKPEKPILVNMTYNVDVHEVNKILVKPYEYFVVLIGVDVAKMSEDVSSSLVVTKKIEPNKFIKLQIYEKPLWVIILAGHGGVLVLALITYGMYKAGFFKRATKEEMDRLLHYAEVSRNSIAESSNRSAKGNKLT